MKNRAAVPYCGNCFETKKVIKMDKYLLKKKFTSEFFASNFDSAVKSQYPPMSEGDVLVDEKFVYSQLEFREKFNPEDISKMRVGGRVQYATLAIPETIRFKILTPDPNFEIRFILEFPDQYSDETIDSLYIFAKGILSQIVALDDKARARVGSICDGFDYEPCLHRVRISTDELELRYHSTTCNTEWGVFFRKEDDDGSWVIDDWG